MSHYALPAMDEKVQHKGVIIEPKPVESGGEPGWIAGCVLVIHLGNDTKTQPIESAIVLPTREEAVIASIELGKRQIDGSPLRASRPADEPYTGR
jgi:hypothetical protein